MDQNSPSSQHVPALTVADFGAIPKGKGYGLVPTFPFRLADVKPGPKALYASLCSNASPQGIVWRSLTKLATEFGTSKRQVQRWVNDLEQAGLIARLGWEGKAIRFLVIRDEAGRQWAKQEFVRNAVQRRTVAIRHARAGIAARWPSTKTPMSQEPDMHVTASATSMSPKHNLPNKTYLTGKNARQGETSADAGAARKGLWGLKRLDRSERMEEVQSAINALADRIGWEAMGEMTSDAIAADLLALLDIRLTPSEVSAFLGSAS